MKWPFVSRLAFDVVVTNRAQLVTALAATDSVIAGLRADLTAERSRYDSLLEKYTSLKMAGAVEVPKSEIIEEYRLIPQASADEMRELIHARAGSNYRMRSMMLSQLAVDRAEGKDPDAIREAILNGVPSDGVPA